MKVIVSPDKCSSSGNCVDFAGSVFSQDERTGVVILLDDNPPESLRDLLKQAEMVCPSGAIRIEG